LGVWRDLDRMLEEIDRSGLYEHELTGECLAAREHWRLREGETVDWRCWRIAASVAQVRAALKGETRAHLTIVHAPEDCVIGGDAAACARVVERVGRGRAIELGLDMIVHCEALAPFAETWRRIHTRQSFPVEGVRFYSNAENRAYVPTREAAAAAITRQALETVDFPKTILQAYADGVRVFIEHGPRGILTDAVGTLPSRSAAAGIPGSRD
jgi:acyl transferase domain-containing protein